METEATIHLNKAECLQKASHFGFKRVHDVCTGTTVDVPWGSLDWALAIGFSGILVGAVITLLALGIVIIRDA